MPRGPLLAPRMKEIKALAESGEYLFESAAKLKLMPATLSAFAKRHGIVFRKFRRGEDVPKRGTINRLTTDNYAEILLTFREFCEKRNLSFKAEVGRIIENRMKEEVLVDV